MIRQAAVEVVTNALEAMPEGGCATIMIEFQDGVAAVVVKDPGPGISPADLDRVFDLDFTTKEPGRGYGLHFAKEAIAAHGGQIALESSAKEGTTIRMVLPLARAGDPEEVQGRRRREATSRAKRIA